MELDVQNAGMQNKIVSRSKNLDLHIVKNSKSVDTFFLVVFEKRNVRQTIILT